MVCLDQAIYQLVFTQILLWVRPGEFEIKIQIATTIQIVLFTSLIIIMLNTMIHTKRKKMFWEKFFSRNVQRRKKRECSLQLVILQLMELRYQAKVILQIKVSILGIIFQANLWMVSRLLEPITMAKLMSLQGNKL